MKELHNSGDGKESQNAAHRAPVLTLWNRRNMDEYRIFDRFSKAFMFAFNLFIYLFISTFFFCLERSFVHSFAEIYLYLFLEISVFGSVVFFFLVMPFLAVSPRPHFNWWYLPALPSCVLTEMRSNGFLRSFSFPTTTCSHNFSVDIDAKYESKHMARFK